MLTKHELVMIKTSVARKTFWVEGGIPKDAKEKDPVTPIPVIDIFELDELLKQYTKEQEVIDE